jgi:phosphoribosylformylglycinamidine synthase
MARWAIARKGIRQSTKESLQHDAKVRRVPKSIMTTVRVYVTLKPSLLDSAGRTVAGALQKLGYDELNQARIGKLIELQVEKYDEARVKEMCDKLLANPVIEDYRIEVAP